MDRQRIVRFHETGIKVRFNETDPYGVAWHGHYITWMEVGRNALAGEFGLGPLQLAEAGFMGPVVAIELKFLKPAKFNDELTVRTTLRRTRTATIEFVTDILAADGAKLASGITTHALTDMDGTLQFLMPPVIRKRLDRMFDWLEL